MKIAARCVSEGSLSPSSHCLKVMKIEDKGEGVRALCDLEKGTFLFEYKGELVSGREGREREEDHFQRTGENRYCFFFVHQGKSQCVDPVKEKEMIHLKVNHSRKRANVVAKVVVDSVLSPHICFFVKRKIFASEELLLDYGDRRKEVAKECPWLNE